MRPFVIFALIVKELTCVMMGSILIHRPDNKQFDRETITASSTAKTLVFKQARYDRS